MSFAGRVLLHLHQWRERHSYEAILTDGADVYRQKLAAQAMPPTSSSQPSATTSDAFSPG